MALNEHHYEINVNWTGNLGTGTSGYRAYSRDHTVTAEGLPELLGSADRTFHGDRERWNPEQLLLTALAQCHMLSYLHVAVNHGVVVTKYEDSAAGTLILNPDGSGQFESATLHPKVYLADPAMEELALSLHAEAASKCFIARSVNFPVHHEPGLLTPTVD
ncbi:organic hydroperoxide reductase OsmC/OhrA [Arthrobacter stackebrandtii]|uniref:Organic hydroperoxide reductase OsmC/OhrA n=1 Tax=Arthrobacter stackebrandtii TaxID=272161 RepID=A0ABS4YZQ1_9MICC|nr:OsmC family protein [Arthrobacter stackebrandtii]MBP2414279.1 organic hydroperoxide reductase OsmC/OhrA [Arthrobacter stackebrandtii]PYH01440.1 peroxiredoxin [Arthrobacter stackebrandtii]